MSPLLTVAIVIVAEWPSANALPAVISDKAVAARSVLFKDIVSSLDFDAINLG
jgi:hypothetical protein